MNKKESTMKDCPGIQADHIDAMRNDPDLHIQLLCELEQYEKEIADAAGARGLLYDDPHDVPLELAKYLIEAEAQNQKLRIALADCDPWDLGAGGESQVCVVCGETWDPTKDSENPSDYHRPDCLWALAVREFSDGDFGLLDDEEIANLHDNFPEENCP
jgi:hypothetical protein